MLIPYLKNVNTNLKRKMIPIGSFSLYNFQSTCCRINLNFVNLKTLEFDRNKIFSLDKWFFNLYSIVLNGKNSIEKIKSLLQFPTPYFDDQKFIDLFCILLFMVDLYLTDNKPLNINFRQELIDSYSSILSCKQSELFYQILLLTNNSFEIISNKKLTDRVLSDLNLFELSNAYTSSYFIPIQHTSFEKWLQTKRIKSFNFKFLKQDLNNFYATKDNKNYNYYCVPDYVFGLADASSGQICICFHNDIEFFQSNTESLLDWFNNGVSLEYTSHKNFIDRFPVDNSIGMQDLMLLFEIWIILRKSFKFRLKKYNSLNNLIIKSDPTLSESWPFNNRIFTLYYFAYWYVFFFSTKCRLKKTFRYSWSKFLQNKYISSFEIDNNLIKSFKFPKKFQISY